MRILFSMPMVIILIALAVISFFFSAVEASHISLNKIRARHLADKGIKGANSVLRLITKLDRMVAAILIGNNFVNVAISSLVTVMLISVFGPNWGAALSTFLVTIFILVFCEIIPKTIAIRYSEKYGKPRPRRKRKKKPPTQSG